MSRIVVIGKLKLRPRLSELQPWRPMAPAAVEQEPAPARGAAPPADGSALSASALRAELFRRLRSTGGRPGLDGADIKPKVPMRRSTWAKLERLAREVESDGFRPSPAQLASVVLEAGIDQFEEAVERDGKLLQSA